MVYSQVVQIKSLMIKYVDHDMMYYGLQSSNSNKQPEDTLCKSKSGVL
jgi:hypothetical protein